jgi:hypothetical protein
MVIGGCVGAYAVFAVVFHWLVEPTLATYQSAVPVDPAPTSMALAPAVRPQLAAPVAAKPQPPAPAATRHSKKTARPEQPVQMAAKPPTVTHIPVPQPYEPARAEPAQVATQTAAQPAAAAPVFPPVTPSRHAARTQTPAQAATSSASQTVFPPAPPAAQTARTQSPAPAASEGTTPDAVAAAAPSAFPEVEEPKKPKKAHRTVHHQQQRDYFNPFRFFAWGSNNGYRRF